MQLMWFYSDPSEQQQQQQLLKGMAPKPTSTICTIYNNKIIFLRNSLLVIPSRWACCHRPSLTINTRIMTCSLVRLPSRTVWIFNFINLSKIIINFKDSTTWTFGFGANTFLGLYRPINNIYCGAQSGSAVSGNRYIVMRCVWINVCVCLLFV